MSWPTPQEYNEAVQNPNVNFKDPELQNGSVETNEFGIPRVVSGSFACVYRLRCEHRDIAVRCFLRNTPDQQARYHAISQFLKAKKLPCTVSFEYVNQGILIAGSWFPILKMEWIYGQPLDVYIRRNAHDKQCILDLSVKFKQMVISLQKAGIAHGDLQHGNILVSDDNECILVDYDGMYVPPLKGAPPPELGHRNYQHPARDSAGFNESLDNFSAWSIYTALLCIAEDPDLLRRRSGCDECILFRQSDYKYPLRSMTFFTLEAHNSEEVRNATRRFRSLLDRNMEDIPSLDKDIEEPTDLPLLANVFNELPPLIIKDTAQVRKASLLAERTAGTSGYPMLTDYIHSASNPAKYLFDPELKEAILALDHGAIRPFVGENGAVFRFRTHDNGYLALKVFFKDDPEREERYHLLNEFLHSGKPEASLLKPFLTAFEYQRNGIRTHNGVYPALKMTYVEGQTLFEAVEANKLHREETRRLADRFKSMMATLRQAGVIHGDIDADNIIVTPNGLKLVDYDNIRTPISMTVPVKELGNRHFRHPRVKAYAADVNDNFPSWVLYTSLSLLAIQHDLWNQTGVKPGRLLFHERDLIDPSSSLVFRLLEDHYSYSVRLMTAQLKMYACWDPQQVPMLFTEPKETSLAAISPMAPTATVSSESSAIATVPRRPNWWLDRTLILLVMGGVTVWLAAPHGAISPQVMMLSAVLLLLVRFLFWLATRT